MPYKWHVIPTNDLKEHTESDKCECKPTIKYVNRSMIIVHNSYDSRDVIEKEIDKYVQSVVKSAAVKE